MPDLDVLLAAVEESMVGMTDTGFCIACGEEQTHCEPDMREGHCESCDEDAVFGAQELLLHVA